MVKILAPVVAVSAAIIILWFFRVWPFGGEAKPPDAPQPATAPDEHLPHFQDVARERGIDFVHFDCKTDMYLIPETMGSGVAWIDYDNDGWPDLFCAQCCPIPPASSAGAPTSRFYHNNRDGTFRDVTDEVGLACRGFGMGCAVGDYDNDGFDDLVVTFLGGVRLFHNEAGAGGRRRFVEVTEPSGIRDAHWATSCAWGDVDGDGLLDLYVCNYVEIDPKNHIVCHDSKTGRRQICTPTTFPQTTHQLFRNLGGGKFQDVSDSAGIAKASPACGLAVVMIDLDGDGLLDMYVANDMHPAYLFHNRGGGKFEEKALFANCALGPMGKRIAGMGIAAGDFDGSGRPSLFVTNYQKTPSVLFINRGNLRFDELGSPSGLGPPSMERLKWGVVLFDADLDGHQDVAVANGHVHRDIKILASEEYQQEAQLFLGNGKGKYKDVSATAGADFTKPRVGRALAVADFDNDGLPDLAYSSVGEPFALFRNATQTTNNWLSLDLVGDGKKSNRNAVGATIKIEAGGKTQYHWVIGGGSYLSASDRRLLIGLGSADKADKITVRYPSGVVQTYKDVEARRWWRLREGNPAPEDATPKRPGQP